VLAPFPSALVEGETQLKTMQFPVGEVTFGTPAGSALFLFAWGEPTLAPPAPGSLGLPRGVEPALALEADLGKLREPFEFFLAREDDTAEVRALLEWFGILGTDPLAVSCAVGHGADRTHVATRYRNWKKIAARQGSLAAEPLSAAELRMVPADATFASLQRLDPLFLVDLLDLFADVPGGPPREKLEAFLGLDLEADLLGPLGRTFGLYMSDTTGGGGLASIVVFAAVEERAKLDETIAHGIETLHALVQGETEGRFRIREWEHAGAACRSLSFPGIPIPFEVSLATSEEFLFLAATPAGLAAALDQARGDAPGLPAHAAFRELGGGALDGLQALRFSDTPRLLADGYGIASLAASAIANGVRSRTDPAREPGEVLPPFHELAGGARPSILLSRIQGDDLVVVGECDGSVVANATAWLGGAGSYLLGLGMLASAALPAMMVRRMESATGSSLEYHRALVDITTIHGALSEYAIQNDGRYPESIEALITPDEHGHVYLDRDSVPLDQWGRPYQYEPVGEGHHEPRVFSLGPDGVVSEDDVDQEVLQSEDFEWADVDSGG
jgi:hypothetical protein